MAAIIKSHPENQFDSFFWRFVVNYEQVDLSDLPDLSNQSGRFDVFRKKIEAMTVSVRQAALFINYPEKKRFLMIFTPWKTGRALIYYTSRLYSYRKDQSFRCGILRFPAWNSFGSGTTQQAVVPQPGFRDRKQFCFRTRDDPAHGELILSGIRCAEGMSFLLQHRK